MAFEELAQAGQCRVDYRAPARAAAGPVDVVLAFASIGHDPTRPPSPEFVATALGRGTAFEGQRHALFVTDAGRSWAADPGFAPALLAARDRLAARGPLGRVLCLGLSMGGFAALAGAAVLGADMVLAFSPQWSVSPAVMPGEQRWRDWTARRPAGGPEVAPLPGCWTCLMHGAADDLAQARGFPQRAGIDQLIFPALGHADLVPHLKARGVLSGLVAAGLAADRRRFLRIATGAGGLARAKFEALPRAE